jgi:hypothetical protein
MKTKTLILLLFLTIKLSAQNRTDVEIKLDKINEILDTKNPKILRYNSFFLDSQTLFIHDMHKIDDQNTFTHSVPVLKIDLNKLKVKKENGNFKIMIVSDGKPAMKLYTFTGLKKEYGVFIDTKENGDIVINLLKEIALLYSQNNQLLLSKSNIK